MRPSGKTKKNLSHPCNNRKRGTGYGATRKSGNKKGEKKKGHEKSSKRAVAKALSDNSLHLTECGRKWYLLQGSRRVGCVGKNEEKSPEKLVSSGGKKRN